MYNPRLTVGDFFEERVRKLFDLIKIDTGHSGSIPDLKSKDGSFYVEVKASAYNNGGVVKEEQLFRFDNDINARRFYAFAYHSIGSHMERDYPNEEKLRDALDLKSLYLFPFSIIKAHYKNSKQIRYLDRGFFVQIRESLARKIFNGEEEVWKRLNLDSKDYKTIKPYKKMHIITRAGHLEDRILKSVNPKYL